MANTWCVEGRYVSSSTSGATRSSWSGGIHQGELAFVNLNITEFVSAVRDLNFGKLIQFFQTSTPSRSGTPTESVSHTCSFCQGGTLHNTRIFTNGRLLKHHTFHTFGRHEFAVQGWVGATQTEASWIVPPKASTSIGDLLSALLSEIISDLTDEIVALIRR